MLRRPALSRPSISPRTPLRAGAALLVLAAALALAAPAAAVPPCYGGKIIYDDTRTQEIGCVYDESAWDANAQALCGGNAVLSPGARGDCYVCVPSSEVGAVLGAEPFEVSGGQQIFHCLQAPTIDWNTHWNRCVFDTYYTAAGFWTAGERLDSTLVDIFYGNDGTLSGAQRAFGWIDCAVSFDGVNDSVVIPDDPQLDFGTGDFSVDFWIRTSQTSGVRSIADKRVWGPYRGWHVYLYNGNLGLQTQIHRLGHSGPG